MPFKTSSTKVHPFVQEYLAALMNAGILLDNLSNIRCGQYELVRLEGVQLDIKQRTRLLKKLESIPSEYLMKYGTRWMDDMLQALELAQKTLDSHASSEICTTAQFNGALTCLKTFLDQAPVVPAATVILDKDGKEYEIVVATSVVVGTSLSGQVVLGYSPRLGAVALRTQSGKANAQGVQFFVESLQDYPASAVSQV